MILSVIGPCGSGKTTIGSALAETFGWTFIDADDFHSEIARRKMENGIPLTDSDRWPWLQAIYDRLTKEQNCVLSCSALKREYREILVSGRSRSGKKNNITFIQLKATPEVLKQRMGNRKGHFMPTSLIDSQMQILEDLDKTEQGMIVECNRSIESVLNEVIQNVNRDDVAPR